MGGEELRGGEILSGEFRAYPRLGQTGPDPGPVVVPDDVDFEPVGEAGEAVLAEGGGGGGVGAGVAGGDEGEDEEDEEEEDEDEHTDEVEAEEAFLLPIGADEASEGDEEECYSDEDERPAEPPDALVVGLRGQPDARGDDGDGAHQGDEIQQRGDVVAHTHFSLFERQS